MSRRRPNAVRASQQRAKHAAVVPGLSPATCHALNRLDRDELRPDVIGQALRRWQALSKPPHYEIRPRSSHLGIFTEGEVRDVLQGAVHALPRRGARQLRRLTAPADRRIRRATLPDPTAAADNPWWHRRLLPGGDTTREPLTPPRPPRPQPASVYRPWAVQPAAGEGATSPQDVQRPPVPGVDVHQRARMYASAALAQGDPTGWFEQLYQAKWRHEDSIPWDRHLPLELLVEWKSSGFGRALVVGCAFGDDAELLAARGHPVTAFDIAPTAVAGARLRYPRSSVDYRVADLLELPAVFDARFDLVVECRTVQYLPPALRSPAIAAVARTVALGGTLLVISTREDEGVPVDGPPWPLTRADITSFTDHGLDLVHLDENSVRGMPGWQAEFRRAP